MAGISDDGSFNLGLANIAQQNYGPNAITDQANAASDTQLKQQQTRAAAMENQVTQARQPLILARLHAMSASAAAGDQSGVSPDKTESDDSGPASPSEGHQRAIDRSGTAEDTILKPGAIETTMRSKYFVPAVPPGAVEAINNAYVVDPTDKNGMGPKSVAARIDMWKTQRQQQSQQGALNDFDKLSAVTDAPDGQAMNVLKASHPEVYAAIKKQFANSPDEDRDEEDQARLFAAHAAGEVHQYTGREAKPDNGGVYRDQVTGIPIPGVERVGLSSEQYLKLAHEAIAPTQVPDGNGGSLTVPAWEAARLTGVKGINGPGDWIMVNASKNNLPGAAATLSPNSAQKKEAQKVATAALATAQKQRAAAPAPADGAPKGTVARNAQGNIDPKLSAALDDDSYKYKPSNNGEPWTPKIGTTPPPAVMDDMKNQTAARNDLKKTANEGVGAASAALTLYKAAQDVLAKGKYDGGAWNAELAKVSKWLPAGWQDHMAGDYQEIAKYLGGAALQSGKGIFQHVTEKDADMLTKELNPSPGMDPTALRDMIAKGVKTSQYALDSAGRIPAYLAKSHDATQFASWNQKHFPMETETKVESKDKVAPKYSDAQVRAYMQKYNLKDETATRKHLGLL